MRRRKDIFKNTALGTVLVIFVFTGVLGLGLLATPKPVRAQAGIPQTQTVIDPSANMQRGAIEAAAEILNVSAASSAASDATTATVKVKESTWQIVKKALLNTAVLALLNAANYAAQKLAYDTANYIASGGKGQTSLFTTESLGNYLSDVGKNAAADALGTLSESDGFRKLGINLCAPSNPQVALNIKLGFLNGLPGQLGGPLYPGAPQPRCDWKTVSGNWSEFKNLGTNEVLSQAGVMFSRGQSALSSAIEFNRYSIDLIDKKKREAVDDFVAKKGFKDLVSKVSGKVLTPAEAIKAEMNRANKESAEGPKRASEIYSAAAIGAGAFQILPAALQMFAGTLGEKLINRIFEKGIALGSIGSSGSVADHATIFGSGGGFGGRTSAELANASLLTPKILSSTNFDELTLFSSCPSEGAQPNNCVMDTDFFNAVQRSRQNKPMTVRQALDQGFLNGSWRLLPLSHPENASRNCYQKAYCYSNLIKLRRARVIPIGWELAANSSYNDVGDPVTLKEVVDNFNNCPVTDTGEIDMTRLPDPRYPWCRLIDPDWILKYPEAICTQEAPGPTLLSPLGDIRGRTCVDSQSCLQEDENGKCVGGYGYCLEEKTFWRLGGDSCPAQFASCQTVKRTDDGREFSYLMNTTEVDICNQENAGCRQYSRSVNLISNGGFEELFGDTARAWHVGNVTNESRDAFHGVHALSLRAGEKDSQKIISVLPGSSYEFSISAIASSEASDGALVGADLRFFDRDGSLTTGSSSELETTCTLRSGGGSAFNEVVTSAFGYLTNTCAVTAPDDAVTAKVTVGATGGNAYVDDIALIGKTFSFNPQDTVFLNGKSSSCPSGQSGCRGYVLASSALLNLVNNPGFEKRDEGSREALAWDGLPNNLPDDLTLGAGSGQAARLNTNPVSQIIDGILPEATYVFSAVSTFLGDVAPPSATAVLTLRDASGTSSEPLSVGDGCRIVGNSIEVALPAGSDYETVSCRFTTNSDIKDILLELETDSSSYNFLVDNIQLELGTSPSFFHEGYSSDAVRLNLKTPPKGLSCTGTASDPTACSAFAPSCRREQVGCDLYSPEGGGTPIPAITSSGDTCPAECSGYETFRQEPTNFVFEEFPVFLIPSTAESCSASEVGCEEFTNLNPVASGGETREYFTSLRLCTQPSERTGTFYTWEGSDIEGFKLRVWQLMTSNEKSDPTGELGSDPTGGFGPCTNLEYNPLGVPQCADNTISENVKSCSKSISAFDPDCREFYDVDGNIHYRYFSKTIVSTNDCSEYRMTRSDEDACRANGGLWSGSDCRYFAVGSLSASCRAEAKGCRAYTGNASRNVRMVINDGFEDGTTGSWKSSPGAGATPSIVNSNESVSAGGHSLKATTSKIVKDLSGTLNSDATYLLSFWAKGTGDISVAFSHSGDVPFTFNRVSNRDEPLSVTSEWRAFTVGPVKLNGEPALGSDPSDKEHLVFSYNGSGAPLYIDNINLQEVAESEYLILDSWRTPASCDRAPNGEPAPQYMLGCRAYEDRNQEVNHLKSFSRLCTEDAVGCIAVYDTQNSDSPFSQVYGAVCTLPDGSDADTEPDVCVPDVGVTCACEVAGRTVCQVAQGGTTCRFDTDEPIDERLTTDGGHVSPTGDTTIVPDDALVYLIDSPGKRCKEEFKGCTTAGLPEFNQDGDIITGWQTRNILDLPDMYGEQTCSAEENFCQAYTRTLDGSPIYFKDPLNHLCEFRTSVAQGGFTFSGWFKKGLDEPCYSDFLEGGKSYGIWKNSDAPFDGWAGECPRAYDQCKEFIDPQDTSQAHPEGQPYYAILNDRLDIATCQNRVSLTSSPKSASGASACVLFDQTDIIAKRYDSAETYKVSKEKNGTLIPAQSTDTNDTNTVIRVERDRRCGEWLDCRSSETVFNPSSGRPQNVCTDFAICGAFEKRGDSIQCTRYVESPYSGTVLTEGLYQSRPIGKDGFDLSGFSLPGKYPINELVTVDISEDANPPDYRLVRSIGEEDCNAGKGDRASCGEPNALGNTGICLGPAGKRQCVYAIDGNSGLTPGGNLDLSIWNRRYPSKSCRAYPQENAPFPSKVADPGGWDTTASLLNNNNPLFLGAGPDFQKANVCQRRFDENGKEYESCECSYQIARYGKGQNPKYFSIEDPNPPAGYCVSGSYEGYECDPRAQGVRGKENLSCCSTANDSEFNLGGCSDGGRCVALSKLDRVVGYEGQCLERDLRNPINGAFDEFACSTWRPVGIVGGSLDIYNLNQSAGYFVKPDRRFYCVGEEPASIVRFSIWGASSGDGSERKVHDWNNDGEINPYDLNITKFFGPGKINNPASNARSQGLNCQKAEDNGPWCVWPGLSSELFVPIVVDEKTRPCFTDKQCTYENLKPSNSYFIDPLSLDWSYDYVRFNFYQGLCKGVDPEADMTVDPGDSANPAEGTGTCSWKKPLYNLKKKALGVLGCYEVADGGTAFETWIDYPYIGPDIYREQLDSIFFQVSDDLYDRSNPDDGELLLMNYGSQKKEYSSVTNPYQEVWRDCNDEGNDNIDNEEPSDSDDTNIVSDLHIIGRDGTAINASYFYLDEENDFEVDPSDAQGTIILKAYFDTTGRLSKIRVAASDKSDEGAFGLREMGFVFKKGCDTVALAEEANAFGLTKALTDRINPFTDYTRTDPNDPDSLGLGPRRYKDGTTKLLQGFEASCQPWGAIGNISSTPSRAPWTFVTTHTDTSNQCTSDAFFKAGPLDGADTNVFTELSRSVRNLFRKITRVWEWKGIITENGPYGDPVEQNKLYGDTVKNQYDDTAEVLESENFKGIPTKNGGRISASYHIPRIASVSTENCTSDGKCPVGRMRSMTINGKESGIITAQGGILNTFAKFYGWASHNAMPILSRRMIWGDFSVNEASSTGWYKNQKPYCSSGVGVRDGVGECVGNLGLTCVQDSDCPGSLEGSCKMDETNHFGNTPGACVDVPFEFRHVYTCTAKDLSRLPVCEDDADGFASNAPCQRRLDPDGAGPADTTEVCVYRPGAQIKDNWDWCNCTGPDCRINGGEYKDGCDPSFASATRKPWTEFQGELRVFPDPDEVAKLPWWRGIFGTPSGFMAP